MKHAKSLLSIMAIGLLFTHNTANAQAYRPGSFFISLSEGTTRANYITQNTAAPTDTKTDGNNNGDRDPITIEYGITKHFGLGLNMGTDIYKLNSNQYYGFQTKTNKIQAFMSEVTIDANYHVYVTKHTDLSCFLSFGVAAVTVKGSDGGDNAYQYNASGGILRTGTKVKYYFGRRFGFMAMASMFTANTSTHGIPGNTVAQNYTTGLSGYAIEFGPCVRIH